MSRRVVAAAGRRRTCGRCAIDWLSALGRRWHHEHHSCKARERVWYTGEIEFLACDEEKDVDQNLWEKFEESFIYEDILEPFSRIETLIQHMQVNGWDFEGQQD